MGTVEKRTYAAVPSGNLRVFYDSAIAEEELFRKRESDAVEQLFYMHRSLLNATKAREAIARELELRGEFEGDR